MNRYPTYENVEYDESANSSEDESEITDYLSSYPQPQYPSQYQYSPMESQSSTQFQRYQPGRVLEPIHTGETLDLHGNTTSYPSSAGHARYDEEDYVPPSMYSGSTTSHDEPEFDHFSYDPEGFTSGFHPDARPPFRSRSPTPRVDDEDYLVDGDRSFHYTGPEPEKDQEPEGYFPSDPSFWPTTMAKHPSIASQSEPETPNGMMHFGRAPIGKTERRHRKKRVKLTNGNLIYEEVIPSMLVLPRRANAETSQFSYSTVFGDPDEFAARQYSLRQVKYKRITEIFVVITMYNVSQSQWRKWQPMLTHR